ncbi:MAG TPA: YhcN/YlaJ family sporulation lipoprotein [Bacillales bacterium]|nr:YhcN/YlaJ family sporulation lipoprotein [Bacillales bacterium]
MKQWLWAVIPCLLAGTIGCGQNNNATQRNANNQSKYMEVKQSVQEPDSKKRQNLSSQDIAKHLVQLAKGVPHVRNATAIVTMGYAVVGIDVDKDIDRSRIGTIKYSVAKAMRHDRYGANAVVVADPDTVQRLKNMGKSIKNGRPVGGVMDELSQIVGRVMPQGSGNLNNGYRPKASNPQNRQQINPNVNKPNPHPKKSEYQATH